MGPCDVLQDLRPRTLRRHTLSQPVSKVHPRWAETERARLHVLTELGGGLRFPNANRENKPRKGGICVANHTSPIDILILCNDGGYAMVTMQHLPGKRPRWRLHFYKLNKIVFVFQVGQVHGGLMGIIQRAMVRSCPHVWFERAEMKDRHLVTKRWAYFFTLSVFLWLNSLGDMLIFSLQSFRVCLGFFFFIPVSKGLES